MIQIIYMIKANGIFPNYENYSNCFILPTDETSNKSKVQAVFDLSIQNTPMNSVNVLYANVEEILNNYIKGQKNNEIIKDLISD